MGIMDQNNLDQPDSKEFDDADERVLHLLDKMAEAHANFLHHKEKAEHFLTIANEINQRIVKVVHKRSEKYRIVDAEVEKKPGAPQNMEDIIEMMFGRK